AVAQTSLDSLGRGIEVVNAGHCGYDTADEAQSLEEGGDTIQPDAGVVAYVLNDAEGPDSDSKARLPWLDELTIVRMRSYLFFRMLMMRHQSSLPSARATPGGGRYYDIVRRQHAPDTAGWRSVEQGLSQIAGWCDRRGVQTILVVYPLFLPHGDELR